MAMRVGAAIPAGAGILVSEVRGLRVPKIVEDLMAERWEQIRDQLACKHLGKPQITVGELWVAVVEDACKLIAQQEDQMIRLRSSLLRQLADHFVERGGATDVVEVLIAMVAEADDLEGPSS